MTKELLKKRAEKQKPYAKYMTTSNPDDNIKNKRCRNEYNHKLRREKRAYFSKLINSQKKTSQGNVADTKICIWLRKK